MPIAGPAAAAIQLNDTLKPFAGFVGITPDSARAIYFEDDGAGPYDLYSVPIDGTGSPTLLTTLPGSALITGFRFSPDGTTIVYVADQDTDETFLSAMATTPSLT